MRTAARRQLGHQLSCAGRAHIGPTRICAAPLRRWQHSESSQQAAHTPGSGAKQPAAAASTSSQSSGAAGGATPRVNPADVLAAAAAAGAAASERLRAKKRRTLIRVGLFALATFTLPFAMHFVSGTCCSSGGTCRMRVHLLPLLASDCLGCALCLCVQYANYTGNQHYTGSDPFTPAQRMRGPYINSSSRDAGVDPDFAPKWGITPVEPRHRRQKQQEEQEK